MHDLKGVVDTVGQQLWVDIHQGVVHPGLVPLLPVRCRQPQVLIRLKFPRELWDFVVLQRKKKKRNHTHTHTHTTSCGCCSELATSNSSEFGPSEKGTTSNYSGPLSHSSTSFLTSKKRTTSQRRTKWPISIQRFHCK